APDFPPVNRLTHITKTTKTTRNNAGTGKRDPTKITALLLVTVAVTGILRTPLLADHISYSFTKVATLGDPAPGPEGGMHVGDFEPDNINDEGEVAFVSDLSTGNEGVFVGKPGHVKQLV